MKGKILQLESNQEIIGILKKIQYNNGKILLTFIIKKVVEIPVNLGLKKLLRKHIGEKIGILHVEGRYLVRKI